MENIGTLIVCPNCVLNIQGVKIHILAPDEEGECPHCGMAFVIRVEKVKNELEMVYVPGAAVRGNPD